MTGPVTTEALVEALTKINGIRNSIIGLQTLNWSEHVYPLVAALDAAGFEGMDYPEARENFGTMLERTNAAEEALAAANAELARLRAEGEAKDRRIAVLTEALAPFARFADMATPDTAETWAGVHHSFRIGTRFKHEHFRAARAATAREGQADE